MKVLELTLPDESAVAVDDRSRVDTGWRGEPLVIGTLGGGVDDGRVPLSVCDGQAGVAALRASTIVDLYADHIGSRVAIGCVNGDGALPIVLGRLQGDSGERSQRPLTNVEIEADGNRVVV